MARTGPEVLHQQGHRKKQGQQQPADPPGNRRPQIPDLRLVNQLEKEDAGGDQRCTGKQEPGSQNQRDAILRALEPDQRDCRENKGENTSGNLKITLQDRIRPQHDFAQPVGSQKNQQETCPVQQDALEQAPLEDERNIAHVAARFKTGQPYPLYILLDAKVRAGVTSEIRACERNDIRCGKLTALYERTG